MATRRSTGGVVVDARRKSAVYALRFRALGKRQYVTLGTEAEGWTTAHKQWSSRAIPREQ